MLITSAKNPRAKHIAELRERKIRESEGVTVLEGFRELSRAVAAGIKITECWHCPEMYLGENEPALIASIAAQGAEIYETTAPILTKMAYRDRPEGLIAVAKIKHIGLDEMPVVPNGLYLIAETIEKPGNLGSMLRSADAVNAAGVIICNRQTDIFNPNVIRASTGAIYSTPVAETSNQETFDWLKKNGILSIAASPHSTDIYTNIDMTRAVAILVGAEQYGLTEFWMKNADVNVRIPMLGKMDSLNVATAATILLYEAARQRNWK